MDKTYKVISSFGFKQMFIEHFDSLEAALSAHERNTKRGCVFSYLLETEVTYSGTGDSANKILEVSKENG